jgi:hypothetical protein
MGSADNADLVRRGYAAFSTGDIAALSELFADDAVWHVPGSGSLSGAKHGRDAILMFFGEPTSSGDDAEQQSGRVPHHLPGVHLLYLYGAESLQPGHFGRPGRRGIVPTINYTVTSTHQMRHDRTFPGKRLVKRCTRRLRGNVPDVTARSSDPGGRSVRGTAARAGPGAARRARL